jgi:predicted  nucleic acid-binding Zn-ribbon protein
MPNMSSCACIQTKQRNEQLEREFKRLTSENQALNATIQSLQQLSRGAKDSEELQKALGQSRSQLQHEQHASREALGRASLLSQEVAVLRSSIQVCCEQVFYILYMSTCAVFQSSSYMLNCYACQLHQA